MPITTLETVWYVDSTVYRAEMLANGLGMFDPDYTPVFSREADAIAWAKKAVRDKSYKVTPDGIADVWRVDLSGLDFQFDVGKYPRDGSFDVDLTFEVDVARLTLAHTFDDASAG